MSEPPGPRAGAEVLALESWRQADEALAQAVIELARALPAARAIARPRSRAAPPRAMEALIALEAAQAALQNAMRRRGLESFAKIEESVGFDPGAHALERGVAHPGGGGARHSPRRAPPERGNADQGGDAPDPGPRPALSGGGRGTHMQDWTVCLDFGTAWSKAAAVKAGPAGPPAPDRLALLPLGLKGELRLPSALLVAGGRIRFADHALAAVLSEPDGRPVSPFLSFKTMLAAPDLDRLLEGRAAPKYDPAGRFPQRALVALFLAFALARLERALDAAFGENRARPALRYTHPAWSRASAKTRHATVSQLFAEADALRRTLGPALEAPEGLPFDRAEAALAKLEGIEPIMSGCVYEAAAAAAARLGADVEGAAVVIDVGAGTTDLGAFLHTAEGLSEVEAARITLDLAGDTIDTALLNLIVDQARHVKGATAQGDLWRALTPQVRALKETLFAQRKLTTRCAGKPVSVHLRDLERDDSYQEFADELARAFAAALEICAGRGTGALTAIASGGGAGLPLVSRAIAKAKPRQLTVREAPLAPAWAMGPGVFQGQLAPLFPQLCVAIGGAAADASLLTAA